MVATRPATAGIAVSRHWCLNASPKSPRNGRPPERRNPRASRGFVHMELGGLEPPTSWVRCKDIGSREDGRWSEEAVLEPHLAGAGDRHGRSLFPLCSPAREPSVEGREGLGVKKVQRAVVASRECID
jgi:hypothetical protein